MFIDDVAITKHNTIYTNDSTHATKKRKPASFNGNNYFTKKKEHTNNTTNNITRHSHNKYEHNVIRKLINTQSTLIVVILK